jgi:hypothetical protein
MSGKGMFLGSAEPNNFRKLNKYTAESHNIL